MTFDSVTSKCVACDVAASCPAGFTGKAANLCDITDRSFVKCKAGKMLGKQTCWNKRWFESKRQKCSSVHPLR